MAWRKLLFGAKNNRREYSICEKGSNSSAITFVAMWQWVLSYRNIIDGIHCPQNVFSVSICHSNELKEEVLIYCKLRIGCDSSCSKANFISLSFVYLIRSSFFLLVPHSLFGSFSNYSWHMFLSAVFLARALVTYY